MRLTTVVTISMMCAFFSPNITSAAPAIGSSVNLKIDSFKYQPGFMITRPELEEKFELEKDALKGKPLLKFKGQFQEALNVAVAESRFLQVDEEGKVSGFFGKADAKTKKIQIYIDYGRYKIENSNNNEQKTGYLMRLEAEITNFDINADISSLFAVGFAAKSGKIQGKVKVVTIGLSGPGVDQYVTTATSISEDSLQKAIENLAVLKSKINTDEITIYPDRLPAGI